jgi:peptidoglycan pentaglycine glycine transferase (the first glycine)
LPGVHILQTSEWGEIKSAGGWQPIPRVWKNEQGEVQAAALILERQLKIGPIKTGLKVQYIPRGPLMDWSDNTLRMRVLKDIQQFARAQKAILIKIDPEVLLGTGLPGTEEGVELKIGRDVENNLISDGWIYSPEQIQFKNSVILDLSPTEDTLLSRMKQKTRYNIRLSQKKGTVIRLAGLEDLHTLYKMYVETSARDGFVIRGEVYYQNVWRTFMNAELCKALLAEVDGEIIAGIVLFHFGGRSWYLYGMSKDVHREKMPNYLLQWEAMRYMKAEGCDQYDLWGAPDIFDESDSMWGVFRFKEGLGGKVIRTIGAWDYTPYPWVYKIYTQVLPRLLDVMRTVGKNRTRRELSQ